MDSSTVKMPTTSLFQVYLRLRPPMLQHTQKQPQEPWLVVEPPTEADADESGICTKTFASHVTLHPPNDSRKRAIERFGFTKVFHEEATQSDVFEETGAVEGIRGVLHNGRDALIATLGVTGSGKSHTILGTKSQRGLTQMSLDVLFRSIGSHIRCPTQSDLPLDTSLIESIRLSDPSDAQIMPASAFLESVYSESDRTRYSRAQTPLTGYGSRAATPLMDFPSTHHTKKMPMPRPSTFAQEPSMSAYTMPIDTTCDYIVLVSMYEVYNDRIFDLLSNVGSSGAPVMATRAGAALQKGLLRRPLLFKNTEQSPDGKVVTGLKKIVCSSYDEAMMVLETGLTERRVAGTGSNSVSSRSHGFFCIEVKKRPRGSSYAGHASFTGGALTIVDLAGSERARNAKTTGSTLAEAGKINESLMYLGQCLQVQSDCQHDGTKPIVPFRQCKLTELLFSNSFPTGKDAYRPPQKAIMIVAADAAGDFNATSQILRYSALAREVTVPRVPSVTVQLNLKPASVVPASSIGRLTPMIETAPESAAASGSYFSHNQELDTAHHEISRLAEECNNLSVRLAEEEIKRTEAELKLQASEEKALVAEQEVREECWSEMEEMLREERQRWRAAWKEEKCNTQDFLDEKIDILDRAGQFRIHEDAVDPRDGRVEELERENDVLRARLAALEQEIQTKSPTKTKKQSVAGPQSPSKTHQIVTTTPVPPRMAPLGDVTPTLLNKNKPVLTYPNLLIHKPSQISRADTPDLNSMPGSFACPYERPVTTRPENHDRNDNENEDESESVYGTPAPEVLSPRKLNLRNSTVTQSSAVRTSLSSATRIPGSASASVNATASPGKKMRKITARRWDAGDDEEF